MGIRQHCGSHRADYYSLIKQVGVPARSFKTHFGAIDLVNQQPIRLDVSIPEAAPPALKRMVFVLRGQGLFIDQQAHQRLDLLHVLAALPCCFQVTDRFDRGRSTQVTDGFLLCPATGGLLQE